MAQPKIRFNGFSDEWDIVKLKDVVIESIEKSATEDQYDVLSSTVNGIELRKGRVSGKSNIGYKVLDLNHLVLSPQNLWLGNINVNQLIKGIVSPSYKVYAFNSDRLLSAYASYMLRTAHLLNEYKNVSVQGASTVRRSLDLNRFYDIKCELPTLPEQQKIGALFSKYDTIIALREQKLAELNALKKGMLQQMFSKNGAKVPELRFEGFTDDWEERKLKDVLDISKIKNKAQQYGKVDVLSVSREVGTVNQIKYKGRSFAGSDLSNYKVVQGGELIYTKSPLKGAPYGIFQVATIKGILSPLYAVYTSTDKAYTPFVAMALKNDNIATHYLTPLVTKGAKNTINVTDEGALEGKIQFPSILEQKQIFIFFKQLDETIALYQRKLDLLKAQKKGLLQQML